MRFITNPAYSPDLGTAPTKDKGIWAIFRSNKRVVKFGLLVILVLVTALVVGVLLGTGALENGPSEKRNEHALEEKEGNLEEVEVEAIPAPSCNHTTGDWKTLANTTFSLGETAAGVLTINGSKYIVAVGETGPDLNPAYLNKTLIHDLAAGTWTVGAARPYAGNHHTAEVLSNELYVIGGLTADSEDKVQIGRLELVDGVGIGIAWRMGTPMPAGRGSPNSAVIDGKIYVCGGIAVDPGFRGNPADLETTSSCALYTPSPDGGAWSAGVADMPFGRNHAAACSDGARLFVFGGRTGGNEILPGFNDTQAFDPASNTWTTSEDGGSLARLPGPGRGGMGRAVYLHGRCYVIGGESFDEPDPAIGLTTRNVFDRVDVYDIRSNSWSKGEALPFGLHGIFPVQADCDIHVTGGGVKVAYSQGNAHVVYSPSTEHNATSLNGTAE